MPVETAAGKRPMQADNAVINMGRMRCEAAWNMASSVPTPAALVSLKYVMTRIPFMTETPNSEINPTAADMLKCSPLR